MGAPAALLVTAHLIGCAFVAYMGRLVAGLGENRTPAEQTDAEQLALMMLGLFGLAMVWWICLLLRRWSIAVVAFVVESVLGAALVLRWLEESVHSDEWVHVLAFAIALTGAGALVITMPASNRLTRRRNMA
jgi:hypothetical protein